MHLDLKIVYSPFCREEGVLSDLEVDYFDNAPCIELLTCQVCCNLCFLSVEQMLNHSFKNSTRSYEVNVSQSEFVKCS